jgi:hypothetical protein
VVCTSSILRTQGRTREYGSRQSSRPSAKADDQRRCSRTGRIPDEQWEILQLAFMSTGRIAILSDQAEKNWMYDYQFLEAVRW